MQAMATERVTAFIQPGDVVVNARAEVHNVFKVMHSGYGFAGAVLTSRAGGNGNLRYVLWVITPEGDIRATMATEDFPAVSGALLARVAEMVR